jgi:peroxiredoxin
MTWLGRLFGGTKMQALTAGTQAPQFDLPAIDGSRFSLQNALSRGPVLAVFFKISCPVCQYALPFYERLYKAYGSGKLSFVAVSQNEKRETEEFMRRFGVSFPVLLDDTNRFPVSNAYGLTTVPTAFWIAEDGEIEISSVSWAREEFEQMAKRASELTGAAPKPIFQSNEQVVDFRAG